MKCRFLKEEFWYNRAMTVTRWQNFYFNNMVMRNGEDKIIVLLVIQYTHLYILVILKFLTCKITFLSTLFEVKNFFMKLRAKERCAGNADQETLESINKHQSVRVNSPSFKLSQK
jgi:hypothetical protein